MAGQLCRSDPAATRRKRGTNETNKLDSFAVAIQQRRNEKEDVNDEKKAGQLCCSDPAATGRKRGTNETKITAWNGFAVAIQQ